MQLGKNERSRGGTMNREPYWDYMGRRLREEGLARAVREESKPISRDDMWKKEIAEMQKNVHTLQLRVKTLTERVNELTNKVTIMGGDPQQLEMEFSDVTR